MANNDAELKLLTLDTDAEGGKVGRTETTFRTWTTWAQRLVPILVLAAIFGVFIGLFRFSERPRMIVRPSAAPASRTGEDDNKHQQCVAHWINAPNRTDRPQKVRNVNVERVEACEVHGEARSNTRRCVEVESRDLLWLRPPALECRRQPCILLEAWREEDESVVPEHSILVTAFLSAAHIGRMLEMLLQKTTGLFELIVVIDGPHRPTEDAVLGNISVVASCWSGDGGACSRTPPEGLVHMRVISSHVPLYETAANNLAMRAARGRFLYLVQDDMFLETLGWNEVLSLPFLRFNDVGSVSGRCGHEFSGGNFVGRCGEAIDKPLSMSVEDRGRFHIRDTGNRGPLVFEAERVRQLGYLDEGGFILGDDDHDFNCRAWILKGWVAGFVAIDFSAPLSLGGSRKNHNRTTEDQNCLKEAKSRHTHGIYQRVCQQGHGASHHSEKRELCPKDLEDIPPGCSRINASS